LCYFSAGFLVSGFVLLINSGTSGTVHISGFLFLLGTGIIGTVSEGTEEEAMIGERMEPVGKTVFLILLLEDDTAGDTILLLSI
jgi:hypothetical protein